MLPVVLIGNDSIEEADTIIHLQQGKSCCLVQPTESQLSHLILIKMGFYIPVPKMCPSVSALSEHGFLKYYREVVSLSEWAISPQPAKLL